MTDTETITNRFKKKWDSTLGQASASTVSIAAILALIGGFFVLPWQFSGTPFESLVGYLVPPFVIMSFYFSGYLLAFMRGEFD